jgi:hypothetical protein
MIIYLLPTKVAIDCKKRLAAFLTNYFRPQGIGLFELIQISPKKCWVLQ